MVEANGRPLKGMRAIAKHANRSEATVLRYIRQENFPAHKEGGIYMAKAVEIDKWWCLRLPKVPDIEIEHPVEIIQTRARAKPKVTKSRKK